MFIFLYFLRIYTYSAYTYIHMRIQSVYTHSYSYILLYHFYLFHPFQNAKMLERVGEGRGTDWLF